ncbi:DUF6374 family protein [Nocardia salmonicida]|uniref:DUF6374 family protein n=1 Tax=Nocardia salmonicida TaxID=53431 RepID=UPI003416EA0A
MPQTSRPDWAAASRAAVRVELLPACAFGAVVSVDQIDDTLAWLDECLHRQFGDYALGRYRPRRRSQPRSPLRCQNCRQTRR